MTEVQSYKALEQAISEGETNIMLTSEIILTACAMAERCGFDQSDISKYIGLVQVAKQDKSVRYDPDYSIALLNEQGRPYRKYITITILANTLRVIQLLDCLHARVSMHRDDSGNLTGVADVTTSV